VHLYERRAVEEFQQENLKRNEDLMLHYQKMYLTNIIKGWIIKGIDNNRWKLPCSTIDRLTK
jgi:hypothetical protein